MKHFPIVFLILIFFSCSEFEPLLEIKDSKSLIPEGIAVNQETGKIYLSSIHQRKIVEYDARNKVLRDLITPGQYGYKRGIGIEVNKNRLFAIGGEEVNGKGSSILVVIDLKTDGLLHSFELQDTVDHFMNDLAVTDNGDIYITDTKRHCVYHLAYPDGEIKVFLQDDQIQYPNGIAVSDDGQHLFVDSWTDGIRIVDLKTKKILNPKHEATAGIGIDGLKYYEGSLYAIKNGIREKEKHGLIQIQVNDEVNALGLTREVLINHPQMDIPTTFCVNDGVISILANSQLENLDQEKNEIIDKGILTNTFIVRREIQ